MRQQMQENMLSYLDEIIELLKGFKNSKHVNNKKPEQVSLIEHHIALLNEEKVKVTQRELIIAVVGTMKAGKSTTINSIVGSEILPNRNEAMTSLPTLITHVREAQEPKLYFPHTDPVNSLVKQIRIKLNELENNLRQNTFQQKQPINLKDRLGKAAANIIDPNAAARRDAVQQAKQAEIERKIAHIKERYTDIIGNINKGFLFKQEYAGQTAIFDFLKCLNDIVRLCAGLGVEFPYAEYTTIAHLPRIEVAFSTLERYSDCEDRLTLLDTPGPNEAGQDHFKPMLDDQLKKSSAVITVVDYTQLNSTSENELRQTVLSLKESFAAVGQTIPVYAIVNKFDNTDANSLDEEGVKKRVGDELFGGTIPREHVLPYSARSAFKANLGLAALSKGITLDPSWDWVNDLKGGLGNRAWERLLNNPEDLKEHFEDQLADSLFNEMINTCVIENYNNVLPQVLQSALNKALIALDEVKNPLDVLFQTMNIDADKLQEAIADIKKNLAEFELACQEFDKKLNEKIAKIDKDIKTTIIAQSNAVKAGWFEFKDNVGREYEGKTFADISVVENISNTIKGTAVVTIKGLRRTASSGLEDSFDAFKDELRDYAKDSIEEIKDKAFDDLKDSGIDATNWKPSLTQVKLTEPENIVVETAVKTKEVATVKRRRQSGIWGGLCGFFGTSDWGWEEYTHYDKVYSVDYRRLLGQFDRLINDIPQDLKKEASDILEFDIKQSFKDYLATITNRFIDINETMMKSAALKENEGTEAIETKREIDAMKISIDACLSNAESIKEAMKTL